MTLLMALTSPCQILTLSQLDNHGRRLLLSEEASLNIPAVAAAHVVKRYTAQAPDELSFEVRLDSNGLYPCSVSPAFPEPPSSTHSQVGDIVSVIDMPPTEDRSWWRGKRGFQVSWVRWTCAVGHNAHQGAPATDCGPSSGWFLPQ